MAEVLRRHEFGNLQGHQTIRVTLMIIVPATMYAQLLALSTAPEQLQGLTVADTLPVPPRLRVGPGRGAITARNARRLAKKRRKTR